MIHIKLFASIRERIGLPSFDLRYNGETTVAELIVTLVHEGEKWQLLQEQDVLVALNQTLCGKDATLKDGDEVAFFPPVTGG